MYGAVVERGKILAADDKKYIVETLDRKGIESLQITALNGAPFAAGDIVYFFLFSDGTGKILCSESPEDATGFVIDEDYVHTDNNFTNEEKKKLADIEAKAQKNVQSDWRAASGDAFIKNKPTIPTKVSELENDSKFVNSTEAADAAPVKSVNGLTGDVDIPPVKKTSQLTNDSGYTKLLDVYPVGSIYMSVNSTNPGTLFGGTWEQLEDRFLLAAGTTYTAGDTGGAETHHHSTANHTLTVSEIPSHTHGLKGWRYGHNQKYDNWCASYTQLSDAPSTNTPITATGGGGAHNHGNTGDTSNMPPYLAVYMWKRTA